MIQIYDKIFDKKKISQLLFVLTVNGFNVSKMSELNIIVYKLYNYLDMDNIDTTNGLIMTNEIKSKIEQFKTIHGELKNPDYEGDTSYCMTFPKLAYNNTSNPILPTYFVSSEELTGKPEPFTFYIDPKTASDYCSVQIQLRNKKSGDLSTEIKYFSRQSFTDLDYWTLRLKVDGSYFAVERVVYNTTGNVIKTESLRFAATVSTNDIKIIRVYGDSYPTETYNNSIADYEISQDTLLTYSLKRVKIGTIYEASGVDFKVPFDILNILDPIINGEEYVKPETINLYDISITKREYASICYLLKCCNVDIKDKIEIDNIVYKMYTYLDDIDFSLKLKVDNELKLKIEDFIKNIDIIQNPQLESGYKLVHTFPKGSSVESDIIMKEYVYTPEVGSEYELKDYIFTYDKPKGSFSTKATIRMSYIRKSDAHKTWANLTTGITFTVPAETEFYKVKIGITSFEFSLILDFFNENNEFISQIKQNVRTNKPSDYLWKIDSISDANHPVCCYKNFKYDFAINKNIFNTIDFSTVMNKELCADIVLINEEGVFFKDSKIDDNYTSGKQDYLSLLAKKEKHVYLNSDLSFITILYAQKEDMYYAALTDRALYYSGVDSTGNDIIVDLYASSATWTGITVYKSKDCFSWEQDYFYIGGGEYEGFHTKLRGDIVFTKKEAITNVVYTNFPMFYCALKHSTATYEEEDIDYGFSNDVDNGTEIIIDDSLLNKTYAPILFRDSDEEEITLGRMPVGSQIKFARHTTEGSKVDLIFRVLDYTNNMQKEGIFPKDGVYMQTQHMIDFLPVSTEANYTHTDLQYSNTHLSRWLNSTAKQGEWHIPRGDYDLPVNEDNCSVNSKMNRYDHRAGFLNSFTEAERGSMLELSFNNGWEGKVGLLDYREYWSSSLPSNIDRPHLYIKDCYLNLHLHKSLATHLNTDIVALCGEEFNNYCYTSTKSVFWRRGYTAKEGSTISSGVNTTELNYNSSYVAPVIALKKDLKVLKTNEEGIFEIDFPKVETTVVDYEVQTSRETLHCEDKSFALKRNIVSNENIETDTKRMLCVLLDNQYQTERTTINTVSVNKTFACVRDVLEESKKEYTTSRKMVNLQVFIGDTHRRKVHSKVREYTTRRQVHGYMDKHFTTNRDILQRLIKTVDVEREVSYTFTFIGDSYRNVVEDNIIDFSTKRSPSVETSVIFDIERNIYRAEVVVFDSCRDIQVSLEKEAQTKRNLASRFIKDFDTRKDVVYLAYKNYATVRDKLMDMIWEHQTMRKVESPKPVVVNFDTELNILNSSKSEYQTKKNVIKDIIVEQQTQRSTLFDALKTLDSKRDIQCNTIKMLDSERDLLCNTEAEYDSKRDIQYSAQIECNSRREILCNTQIEYDLKRDIQCNAQLVCDSYRNILVEEDKYCDMARELLQTIDKEIDTNRETLVDSIVTYDTYLNIVSDMLKDFDTIKEVIGAVCIDFDTSRDLAQEKELRYMSLDNLEYYTQQLKTKLDSYLQIKVKELVRDELSKLNQER